MRILIKNKMNILSKKDGAAILCPMTFRGDDGYDYCTDRCAWFRIGLQNTNGEADVFCGDKLIGEVTDGL